MRARKYRGQKYRGQVLCFASALPFRCNRLSLHYSRVSQVVREAKRKT